MIHKKTVLILGAGASVGYGFPTGPKLINKIVANCADMNGESRRLMRLVGADDGVVERFLPALKATQLDSIDDFLTHRPAFREVGKLAIAVVLIPCENPVALANPKPDDHWYRLLFNHLIDKRGFSGSGLTIITLNYDRSLEQYLYSTVKEEFALTEQQTAEKLGSIPFIHFHGQLGLLPWRRRDVPEGSRVYRPDLDEHALRAAASQIRIVSDFNQDRDVEFTYNVTSSLAEAEVIGFLGFGYNEVVMERFKIAELVAPKSFFGTTYKLPNGRRTQLNQSFGKIELGDDHQTVKMFIEHSNLLYQSRKQG
jgi:hypothetical protein